MRIFTSAIVGSSLAVLALSPTWALAQTRDAAEQACSHSTDPQLLVSACTSVIENTATTAQQRLYALVNRANGFEDQGELDRSMSDLTRAIELDRSFEAAWANRGRLHFVRRDYEAAVADFTEAHALAPQDASTLFYRGLVRLRQQDYDSAIEDYRAARALPDSETGMQTYIASFAVAFRNRGVIALQSEQYAAAISDFEEAARIDPTDAEVHFALGTAFAGNRNYADAVRSYDRAIMLRPDQWRWRGARCWQRAVWGEELNEAVSDCSAVLAQLDDPSTRESRALAYLRLGNYGAALADYDAVVQGGGGASALFGRGLARVRLGQRAAGQADIADAEASDAAVREEYQQYGLVDGH